MDNFNLETYLEESKASFDISGNETKFFSLYDSLKSSLTTIHSDVTSGANLAGINKQIEESRTELSQLFKDGKSVAEVEQKLFNYENIVWLNDHGPNHIKNVIKRASQLLQNVKLTYREIYCLLCAIQLHDIGNVFGRLGHETRIKEVIADARNKIGSDHIERKYITQIAQVHGGIVDITGSKDTISILKPSAPVMDENVRIRLLAAIVRFADELADERYRASIKLLEEGKIPKSSEIYHAYSSVISSVLVNHEKKVVEVHFDIPKNLLCRKFGKGAGEIYLIDEIYERTLKMYKEKVYCSRFWKTCIDIESILVIMNFFDDDLHGEVLPEMTYTLTESGYPTEPNDIYKICGTSLIRGGTKMDGSFFKSQLN